MAYFLGVDTGGTYTDAVIVDEAADRVIGSAKSLTTRNDLAIGIGKAVDAALAGAGIAAGEVALVSLSTTLATNALVEGQGGRVALVFIGFDPDDLDRGGLTEALKGDPVLRLEGGHSHAGGEVAPLDMARLEAEVAALGPEVMGFAVAARFATRNPAHEIAARDAIRRVTGRPVTCSHELSAQLNGPKRALTAVLNARLIGMIDRLVAACERHLLAVGIAAPLDGGARRWGADFRRHGARTPDRDNPVGACRQHRWRALADRGKGRAGQRHWRHDYRRGACCATACPRLTRKVRAWAASARWSRQWRCGPPGLGGDSPRCIW